MPKKPASFLVASPPAPARPRLPDSEKLTLNLGFVDLGQVDLLVSEGFYGNRSDFIRTAIRNQLAAHADPVRQAVTRRMLVLGAQHLSAANLERTRAARERLQVRVLGLFTLADDVTVPLALDTIESVEVLGAWLAPPAVKAALLERVR